MAIKKATISNWQAGVSGETRAETLSELNSGFYTLKNFDIYETTKKAIPVPEWLKWNTEQEETLEFKGFGASDGIFYATGKSLSNWYSTQWKYRIRIDLPSSYSNNFVFFDLENLPAHFWANVKDNGGDVKVIDQNNNYRNFDIFTFDKVNEKGHIAISTQATDEYFYIYYGNENGQLVQQTNTSIFNNTAYGGHDYVYTFQDINQPFPTSRGILQGITTELNFSSQSEYATGISDFITNGLTSTDGTLSYRNNTTFPTILNPNFPHTSGLFNFSAFPSSGVEWIIMLFNERFDIGINTDGTLRARMRRVTESEVTISGTTVLNLNETYHIAITYDRTADNLGNRYFRLWLNGQQEAQHIYTSGNLPLQTNGVSLFWQIREGQNIDLISYLGGSPDKYNQTYMTYMYENILDNANFWTVGAFEELTNPTYASDGTTLYFKPLGASEWDTHGNVVASKTIYNPVIQPINATSLNPGSTQIVFFNTSDSTGFLRATLVDNFSASIVNPNFSFLNFIPATRVIPMIVRDTGIDNAQYYGAGRLLQRVLGGTFQQAVFASANFIRGVEAWNGYITMAGYREDSRNSFVQIWDRADTVATQSIDAGLGKIQVLGSIKGNLFGVVNNFIDEPKNSVERPSMDIRFFSGGSSFKTTHKIQTTEHVESPVNIWEQPVSQLKGRIKNAVLFYAKIPRTHGMEEGLWAVGMNETTDQLALSLMYSTEELGHIYNMATFTNQCGVLHDNKVSILSDNPQYTRTSEIITKVFTDGNSDTEKELSGVEIMTEALEEGQVVKVYKKSEKDTDWVQVLEHSEYGIISKETTVFNGKNFGKWKEIQFKITSTGGRSALTQLAFRYETLSENT